MRTYFYSQAGNRVPPIYCIYCRVEGKSGLITVGRILLNYILILCETNFVLELLSHVVCSAAELALKRNNLLYSDLLSFRLFWGHEDWTNMTNVLSQFWILHWTTSFIQLWNAYFRLHHKSCSEEDTTVYPSLRRTSYRWSLVQTTSQISSVVRLAKYFWLNQLQCQ